jgi:integrase
VKLPQEGPPRERWYTEDELQRYLEQPMSPRCRNFTYLAMGTWARKTAITTLPVKRVDLVNGYIDYRDPALPVTKKRRPKVKIADWLLPLVRVMCEGKKPNDLVIGMDGPQDVFKEVKHILRRIGIDERGVACHAFRRTGATWALINGAPLASVAATLGDTVQTTERNYISVLPQHTAGAVNSIPSPERK